MAKQTKVLLYIYKIEEEEKQKAMTKMLRYNGKRGLGAALDRHVMNRNCRWNF